MFPGRYAQDEALNNIFRILAEGDEYRKRKFDERQAQLVNESNIQNQRETEKLRQEQLDLQKKQHEDALEGIRLSNEALQANIKAAYHAKRQQDALDTLKGLPVPGRQEGPATAYRDSPSTYQSKFGLSPDIHPQVPTKRQYTFTQDIGGEPQTMELDTPEEFARQQVGLQKQYNEPEVDKTRQVEGIKTANDIMKERLKLAQEQAGKMEERKVMEANANERNLTTAAATIIASQNRSAGTKRPNVVETYGEDYVKELIDGIRDGIYDRQTIRGMFSGNETHMGGEVLNAAGQVGINALDQAQGPSKLQAFFGHLKPVMELQHRIIDQLPENEAGGIANKLVGGLKEEAAVQRNNPAIRDINTLTGYAAELASNAGTKGAQSDTDIALARNAFIPKYGDRLSNNIKLYNDYVKSVRDTFDADFANISKARRDAIWNRLMPNIKMKYDPTERNRLKLQQTPPAAGSRRRTPLNQLGDQIFIK